jgi:hypothetical protein
LPVASPAAGVEALRFRVEAEEICQGREFAERGALSDLSQKEHHFAEH